jgi:hypothetical protein
MEADVPEGGKTDRRGPILFGLTAVGVLAPHVFGLVVTLLNAPAAPLLVYGRLILWGALLYLLGRGYLWIRWVVLVGVVLGASTLGLQAVRALQAGYRLPAADFAVLALAQVGAAALLFGSRSLRDWLKARRSRRVGPKIQ